MSDQSQIPLDEDRAVHVSDIMRAYRRLFLSHRSVVQLAITRRVTTPVQAR